MTGWMQFSSHCSYTFSDKKGRVLAKSAPSHKACLQSPLHVSHNDKNATESTSQNVCVWGWGTHFGTLETLNQKYVLWMTHHIITCMSYMHGTALSGLIGELPLFFSGYFISYFCFLYLKTEILLIYNFGRVIWSNFGPYRQLLHPSPNIYFKYLRFSICIQLFQSCLKFLIYVHTGNISNFCSKRYTFSGGMTVMARWIQSTYTWFI